MHYNYLEFTTVHIPYMWYIVILILMFICRLKENRRIMVCIYHLLMAVLVNFWMKKDCSQIMLYKAMSLS